MIRGIIGVFVAAVVLFFWGFVYWGLGPYPKYIWKQARDDAAAQLALRKHFPDEGTYHVPSSNHAPEKTKELMGKGPVALVHVTAAAGRQMMPPEMMVQGFLLNVVALLLLALLLRQVSPAFPSYFGRVCFVLWLGVLLAVFHDFGDIVWWWIDWKWKLYQAGYAVSFWLIAGLVLAWFIGRQPAARTA